MDATLAQQEEDRLELDNEDYELRLSSKHSGKPQLERSRTQDGRSEPTQASNECTREVREINENSFLH